MRRFAQLSSVLILAFIMSGCGDTYRPVVIPNPPPTPDPKPAHNMFVISNNGTGNMGTGMQVNVSGDTNMGVIPLGIAPVHASLTASGSRVLSANFLNDTVSVIAPASTLGGIAKVADVVFPNGFGPSFVATTETSAFYVAGAGVVPQIAFVSGTSNAVIDIKPLPGSAGTTMSMAETADARKLYVASSNANLVVPVNPVDRTLNPPIPVATPIWVSARSDGQRAYVLSQATGIVTEVNPLDDSVIANPSPINAGPGANYMFYDSRLNRLYVTNPLAATTTVANLAPEAAVALKMIPIAPVTRNGATDVCAIASPGPVRVVSATALPDGTKAYVGGFTTLTSGVNISQASGDGTLVTYSYSTASGPSLVPRMGVTITGFSSGSPFNGNYTIATVGAGTFQVFSSASGTEIGSAVGLAQSICPQVTVLNTSDNTVRSSIPIDRAPSVFGCDIRFRLSMASSADSSKVYLGSCDAGGVSIIHTDLDQVSLQLSAPPSALPSLGGQAPPPQNPVFVLSGQ